MLLETSQNSNVGSNPVIGRWPACLATALVWIGILVAYRSQVALIVDAWEKLPSHAHGYVVLLVVAYLAWRKRTALAGIRLTPSKTGIAALLLAGAAGSAGELVSAAIVVQFAVVFMLQCAVWSVMGDRAFRILVGPLCFLFFAIPFGHDILPTLMDWTANATVIGLRASGVPVLQDSRNFVIPSGSWSVVEACGGIRYLLTAFFVGAIFAYITYSKWHKRLIFLLWMLVLPLLANWLRAYTIVMVAHLTNNQWGLGLSHLTFGWVIFGLAMFGSFTVGSRWRDPEIVMEKKPLGSAAPVSSTIGAALLALVLVLGWSQATRFLMSYPPRPLPLFDLSKSLKGLEKVDPILPMVVPQLVGTTAIHQATYRFGNGEIGFTVGYYRNQRQGAKLASVLNVIEPSRSWMWHSSGRWASLGDGIPELQIETYGRGSPEVQAVVAQLYWVGGRTTVSDVVSKFYQAMNLITGKGDDGAIVVITATDNSSAASARALLEAFVRDRLPRILVDLDAIQTSSTL